MISQYDDDHAHQSLTLESQAEVIWDGMCTIAGRACIEIHIKYM